MKSGEKPTVGTKVLAGLLSGAIGITCANPMDVAKIRLQS